MKIVQRTLSLFLCLILFGSTLLVTASASETTYQGIGFVTASSLRLREEASIQSKILDTAEKNDCVVVISQVGDWYKVNYNLQEGYMYKDYLTVSPVENAELGYGKITGKAVNLRAGPSTSHSVSAVSAKNDTCYIIGLNNGWFKVIYEDKLLYIRSDYVELTEIPYENADSKNAPKFFRLGKSTGVVPSAAELKQSTAGSPASSAVDKPVSAAITGSQILTEAKKHLGTQYLSGGASSTGFDCSGLVYYVLKQLGYSPYRTPADQYKHGTYVDKAALKAGDLVFFAGTGASGISHVGIYAGNGQFIHAPNSGSVVSYSSLISGYWADHYYGARRIG